MIAGLERPTSGEIHIGDQRVDGDVPPRARGIAMVFQSYALYPHRTVFQNIAFPLEASRTPRKQIEEKVRWAAELFSITRYLDRYPRQLSGGERQRVALCRALVRDPKVFLLDEPLANLDAKLRNTARDDLKRLQRRIQTTTVCVTHDQVEAQAMSLAFRPTPADRGEVLAGVMLAPALAYVTLLVGVPFVFAIALGFSNATAGSLSFGWAGLQNYTAILADPIFLRALRNSVVVTVGSQVLVVVLATAAAQVFRATFRGKRFARFVLLLPWAVPVSLAAIAWTWIFDSTFSVINWTLKAAGLLHGWLYWLGEPALALLAIIIVQAWRIFPFATVIVLAGLSSIPQEIVEAAIVDGGGFWRRLFQVELPLLLPVVAVAVLFGVVYTATDLGVVYILTGGGPANTTHVLPTLAFQRGILGADLGQGAAIAVFLLPFLIVVAVAMLRLARRAEVGAR